jgi:D-3-phosphoglycerate dehydrogenase
VPAPRLTALVAESDFDPAAVRTLSGAFRVLPYDRRASRIAEAEVLVTALELRLDKRLLDRAPRLALIGSRTTQLRHIDLPECARRGIKVVNIKANSPVLQRTTSTAEEAMALLLALVRRLPWAFQSLSAGRWERKRFGGHEVAGKTLGVIGFGRLGTLMARYGRALGMKVLATDPFVNGATIARGGARKVNLATLLRSSDFVSLHSIYDESTFRMLRAEHFRLMRPGSFFINTARGEITDEQALLAALKRGHLAGAALDTLAGETPDGSHLRGNPLVKYAASHDNLLIVPHLGGATIEATSRTQHHIVDLVIKAARQLR